MKNLLHSPEYTTQKRWSMATWLIIPLLLVWITTNYILGILRPPSWSNQALPPAAQGTVIDSPTEKIKKNTPTLHWQGTGLVTLWFDDAWITQYTVAYPMLESYHYKGTLAVPTKLVNFESYMSWPQVKRLNSVGWEITSHTRNHNCAMNKAKQGEIESEIGGALFDLKAQGLDAQHYVSPCGVDTPLMKSVAMKYYLSYRTSLPGFNQLPIEEAYSLKVQTMRNTVTRAQVRSWIQTAKESHTWLILMFHQVDKSGSEYSITPEMLHFILEEIRTSDMPVVVPSQTFEMIDESAFAPTPQASVSATPIVTPTIKKKNIHDF